MGIDGTGFGDWTPRQESTTGQEQHREIGTITEQEKEESNTGGGGVVEDATQVEQGVGTKNQAAIVTNKAQAQETKGQPKKGYKQGINYWTPSKTLNRCPSTSGEK